MKGNEDLVHDVIKHFSDVSPYYNVYHELLSPSVIYEGPNNKPSHKSILSKKQKKNRKKAKAAKKIRKNKK